MMSMSSIKSWNLVGRIGNISTMSSVCRYKMWNFHRVVVVVLLVLCTNIRTINSELELHDSSSNIERCRDVIDLVLSREWGHTSLVASSPGDGRNLRVCQASESSCCTRELEQTLHSISVSKFQQDMQVASSYIKFMISTNKVRFQGEFTDIIQNAENRTHTLFKRMYPFIANQMKGSVIDLHAEMKLYYQGAMLNIDRTVQDFFSYMFPYVFQYMVDGSLRSMYDNYRNCLMRESLQEQIKPFGDIPERSAKQIAWTLEAARLTIKSLNLALNVIRSTDTLDLTNSCSRALLNMNYCTLCEGHVSALPCYGYCLNVMRGCLASVYELDTKWNEMVTSLTAMIGNMYGRYSMEDAILKLPERISDAIQYAAVNAATIKEQVYNLCGEPHRTRRSVHVGQPTVAVITDRSMPLLERSDIQVRLRNFMDGLASSEGFYSRLPESVCEGLNLPSLTAECWNGIDVDRYDESVVGSGIGQQIHNPEVVVAMQRDMTVTKLMNELASLTSSLNRATKLPDLPGPRHESWFSDDDSDYFIEGSGSGSGDEYDDDDDYRYDNTNDIDSDIDIVFTDTDPDTSNEIEITVRSQQNKPGSSSSNILSSLNVISASVIAVTVLLQHLNFL